MPKSTAEKLRIKPGYTLLAIDAPAEFPKDLQMNTSELTITNKGSKYDQVHWFVKNKAGMEKGMPRVMQLLKPGVIVWVYYPKGTSKIQTDLTRDKGWDSLLAESDKVTWISLISFNDTWSVFGFRAKTDEDKKKESKPQEREIFKWVDPKTKEVRLPADVATAFRKSKKQFDFFETLSFTNKKEFLEWIVTAKREETRNERVKGTIDRLAKGWKNPRNV